ncbi:MAG: hypothetical protein AB7J73_00915, partial [Gammaproteobacteria bacterium]
MATSIKSSFERIILAALLFLSSTVIEASPLFAMNNSSLSQIDQLTGADMLVSNLDFNGLHGGLVYGDGYLFAITHNGTYRIDPATGQDTYISSFRANSLGADIAYGDGQLFAMNYSSLSRIDIATGADT